MSKKVFSVRLTAKQIAQIAQDRKSSGSTNNIVVSTALEDFFTRRKPDERRKFYIASGHVPYGRET
jgi:hypothetical protein